MVLFQDVPLGHLFLCGRGEDMLLRIKTAEEP